MPNTAILFVTNYFIDDPQKIGGGVGERLYGLYYTFTKKYSKFYRLYWYSWQDHKLRSFDEHGNLASISNQLLPTALMLLLTKNLKKSLIVCLAYPYGCRGLEYLLSLFFLTLFRLSRLILIVTDYFDPPIESKITFEGKMSFSFYIWSTIKDFFTLKISNLIIFVSRPYLEHATKRYSLKKSNTYIIQNGSFPRLISPNYPKKFGSLALLYSGSLIPAKDIPALIRCVERVREKGYDVNLVLTGYCGIPFKEKEYLKHYFEPNWLSWVNNILIKADVGVLPYPKRIHWDLTHLAKIPDYMSAGKPIVSMKLLETARILETHNCGLIAHDWDEFEKMIIKLYEDRKLAIQLGKNGRRAVEKYYDYEKHADRLASLLKAVT